MCFIDFSFVSWLFGLDVCVLYYVLCEVLVCGVFRRIGFCLISYCLLCLWFFFLEGLHIYFPMTGSSMGSWRASNVNLVFVWNVVLAFLCA